MHVGSHLVRTSLRQRLYAAVWWGAVILASPRLGSGGPPPRGTPFAGPGTPLANVREAGGGRIGMGLFGLCLSIRGNRSRGHSRMMLCGNGRLVLWVCSCGFPLRLGGAASAHPFGLIRPRRWLGRSFPDYPLTLSGLASTPHPCTHFRMAGPPASSLG